MADPKLTEDRMLMLAKAKVDVELAVQMEADRTEKNGAKTLAKQLEIAQASETAALEAKIKLQPEKGKNETDKAFDERVKKFQGELKDELDKQISILKDPKKLAAEVDTELKKRKSDKKADVTAIKAKMDVPEDLSAEELFIRYIRTDAIAKAPALQQARSELEMERLDPLTMLKELHTGQRIALPLLPQLREKLLTKFNAEQAEDTLKSVLIGENKKMAELKSDSPEYKKIVEGMKKVLDKKKTKDCEVECGEQPAQENASIAAMLVGTLELPKIIAAITSGNVALSLASANTAEGSLGRLPVSTPQVAKDTSTQLGEHALVA